MNIVDKLVGNRAYRSSQFTPRPHRLEFTAINKEIEASKKRHMDAIVGVGGERVILTFKATEEGGQNGTRVVGETKKNFIGHVSQRTWTDAVLAQIACKLRASSR